MPLGTSTIGILLLLKAFAGGSVALTGVEAIANGVPAFKPPEARNAANTMTAMAVLLGILFIGLTVVAVQFGLRPTEPAAPRSWPSPARTASSATARSLFVTFAASTALILFLAANTSFNAFPRLAAILAEDGYMPRQFSFRGDRLAYSWGIVLLAAIAFLLLAAFGGDTHSLIPLYSVGVFVCFTPEPDRDGPPLVGRAELAAGAGGWSSTPSAAVLTAVVLRGGRLREVRRRGLPRGDPGPDARPDDAVHQASSTRAAIASSRSRRISSFARRIARSAWSSRSPA